MPVHARGDARAHDRQPRRPARARSTGSRRSWPRASAGRASTARSESGAYFAAPAEDASAARAGVGGVGRLARRGRRAVGERRRGVEDLAHLGRRADLDGLNLCRAWCWRSLAPHLPAETARSPNPQLICISKTRSRTSPAMIWASTGSPPSRSSRCWRVPDEFGVERTVHRENLPSGARCILTMLQCNSAMQQLG